MHLAEHFLGIKIGAHRGNLLHLSSDLFLARLFVEQLIHQRFIVGQQVPDLHENLLPHCHIVLHIAQRRIDLVRDPRHHLPQ